jgi:two-component system phosphate regulon sensor histidine kinase PhoR
MTKSAAKDKQPDRRGTLRNSLALLAFFAMVVVVSAVALVAVLMQGNKAVAWVAVGLLLSAVFAVLGSLLVNRELAKVDATVRALPEFDDATRASLSEFDDTIHTVQGASARLQRILRAAGEERKQLEALLDSMQDAVVAVDSAGRIQWTNQRMQRLIPGGAGVSGAVRVGHALVQTIRDPDVLESVRQALEAKTVTVRGAASLLPGRIFEVNAAPMPGGGAVAVLHDITRIEEVERTQRDFVANVSHELRTPLTSISGYVETLLDHENGISAQGREFLKTILKNATRMNRLTEDLLVMARVEGPSGELNPAPVRADVLVRDAIKAMQGLVQENQAILEIGEMTDAQVFADSDSVMQVLGNLIENAIKYGPPRSDARARVVIGAREVAQPFEAVEFSVQDFGSGIASEHLNRIFERFYRVDKTRSRESGGTGLGLAIARHMVQSQGGTIRAESELGEGSTFVFTLPKALYPVAG